MENLITNILFALLTLAGGTGEVSKIRHNHSAHYKTVKAEASQVLTATR